MVDAFCVQENWNPLLIDWYSLQEGIPEGFAFDFDAGIFFDIKHLQLQSVTGWHSFVMLNHEQRTIDALLHVYVEKEKAISPLRSPYGSFIFSENVPQIQLSEFIRYTEKSLAERGGQSLLLKNPPEIYNPLLYKLLLESGYLIHLEETSAVIGVDGRKYAENLNQSKKSLLKKCHDNQLHLQQFSLDRLSEVFDFLKKCYTEKGYAISMTFEEVQKVTQLFPESFFLHVVFHNEQMVAACISIRVKQTVLYTFYYNHLKEYDFMSPIVFLIEGLYQFCQEKNIQLLDLGTSNKGDQINEPLLNFKISLGAQRSRKITFVKKLS